MQQRVRTNVNKKLFKLNLLFLSLTITLNHDVKK